MSDHGEETQADSQGGSLAADTSTSSEQRVQLFSLIAAFLTIFTFLKDAAEIMEFMVQNMAISLLVTAGLLVLFARDLFGLKAGRLWSYFGPMISRLGLFLRKLVDSKIAIFGRAGIVVVALMILGIASLRVYVAGVYYILLESSRNQEATEKRVDQLNEILLENEKADLILEATRPLGRSQYYGITIGPIYSEEKADEMFEDLKEVLGEQEIRDDAGVKEVPLSVIWRKATGFLKFD